MNRTQVLSMQVAGVMNNALNKIRAAGAILVPVDSSSLGAAAAHDWGGVLSGPGPYMVPGAFARCNSASFIYLLTNTMFLKWLSKQSSTRHGQSPSASASGQAFELIVYAKAGMCLPYYIL